MFLKVILEYSIDQRDFSFEKKVLNRDSNLPFHLKDWVHWAPNFEDRQEHLDQVATIPLEFHQEFPKHHTTAIVYHLLSSEDILNAVAAVPAS